MVDKRKYPLNESKFKELIEPIIEEDKKKSGIVNHLEFDGVVASSLAYYL